jgi:hypothetical protein
MLARYLRCRVADPTTTRRRTSDPVGSTLRSVKHSDLRMWEWLERIAFFTAAALLIGSFFVGEALTTVFLVLAAAIFATTTAIRRAQLRRTQ